MKRLLFSSFVILLVTVIASPIVFADMQTDRSDRAADANGDGKVTLAELRRYNREVRDKK